MKVIHYAVVLALVCLAAALGVAGTFRLTRPKIELKERAAQQQAQAAVVTQGLEGVVFTVIDTSLPTDQQVMRATIPSGEVVGFVALGEAQGYAGKVRMMVGMDPKARNIVGLKVVYQNETPGLGTRIEEMPSRKTWVSMITGRSQAGSWEPVPMFLKQFFGKTADELVLTGSGGKGIQAISGATISSRAVVEATRDAVVRIQKAAGSAAKGVQAVSGATVSSRSEVEAKQDARGRKADRSDQTKP